MSKRETEMTRWFWEKNGGALYEEFCVVRSEPGHGRRLIDGLIVLGEEKRRTFDQPRPDDLLGKDVIVVQTKNARLGMYLMGQTLFSRDLVRQFQPGVKSIQSVALVSKSDDKLAPLLTAHGCTVEVCPPEICALRSDARPSVAVG
jgi:hypothetical protein